MKINIGKYPLGSGKRKIDIQIDRYDTYSMDHTLAMIILPMLLQLKQTKQGVPAEFADIGGADHEKQESFDFYKEDHHEMFNKSVERYEEILDKMIWSFQQIVEDNWESNYYHGEGDYEWKEIDETQLNPLTGKVEKLYEMVDKNPEEHWIDFEGMEEHRKRIQEGINLFAKYYFSLWD